MTSDSKTPIWSYSDTSSYEGAALSWKRIIASKCDQLAGSVNGYLDPRIAVDPDIASDLWFAPPGSTLLGTYYSECITVGDLRIIASAYLTFLTDPDRLPANIVYIDDDQSFVHASNLEAYVHFTHGPDKILASDDLARKKIPRRSAVRPLNLEPIANKIVTQFHQAWSLICAHFEISTQNQVDQMSEINIACSNSDIVRVLYELELMGLRGNRSDQDVRKSYEDQLLEPDRQTPKTDQSSKFGSSPVALTNYNNQSKRLYRAAMALKSNIPLDRFIIG